MGLDELDVLARARRGDLHEHVAAVSPYQHDRNRLLGQTCHYKKFPAARQLLVSIATEAPFMRMAREKCRTRVIWPDSTAAISSGDPDSITFAALATDRGETCSVLAAWVWEVCKFAELLDGLCAGIFASRAATIAR